MFVKRLSGSISREMFIAAESDFGKYSISKICRFLQKFSMVKVLNLDRNPIGD